MWGQNSNDVISAKQAYNFISKEGNGGTQASNKWSALWKMRCPQKFKLFCWLFLYEALMVNKERKKRGFTDLAMCEACGNYEESSIHALRDCRKVMDLWQLHLGANGASFFTSSKEDWFMGNIGNGKFQSSLWPEISWGYVFLAMVWQLWKARNRWISIEKPCQLKRSLLLPERSRPWN